MIQVFIALFGLSSIWMAMGNNPRARKWAPIVGLAGQPFWAAFAWQTQGWGLGLLVVAYTAVYVRGAWLQWRPIGELPSMSGFGMYDDPSTGVQVGEFNIRRQRDGMVWIERESGEGSEFAVELFEPAVREFYDKYF